MKILIYSLNLFGKTGVATYVRELSYGLAKKGHTVDVGFGTLSRKEYLRLDRSRTRLYNTVDFRRLRRHEYDVVHVAEFTISRYYKPSGKRASLEEATRLYIRAYRNFIKAFKDVPKTVRIHGLENFPKSPLFYTKYWPQFGAIITSSDEAVPHECIHDYWNVLLPINTHTSLGVGALHKKRNLVVSAVKVMRQKGVTYLMDICNEIEGEVAVWGDIIDPELVQVATQNLPKNVRIVGDYKAPWVPYRYAKVACNLSLPNIHGHRPHALPRLEYATLEAMKYGAVPVVFTPFSTTESVVGIELSSRESTNRKLLSAINTILGDQKLYREFALKNINFVRRNHDTGVIVPQYEKIWRSLM